MAEIAVAIIEKTVMSIVRQVEYVSWYKKNLNELKEQVEELKIVQEVVIHEVKAGRRDGKAIEDVVVRWLNRVDESLQEADKLFKDPRNATAVGSFPNLKSRYLLSRKAKSLAVDIDQLSSAGRFDQVTKTHGEELESRKLMKEEIVSVLRYGNLSIIGIYGLAGVGKTFLAQQVAQQVEGDMFKVVYLTTASQTTLDVDERIMKEEGRILIILDDVWGIIDLQELGIFHLTGRFRVLLISRNQHMLQKNGTQRDFKLEVLDDAESWSLFQSRAGGDVFKDAHLRNIAKQLAQRCAGLPIAIITMAESLKDKGVSYWEEALRILNENDYEKMEDTIYSSVQSSYNQLEGDEVKRVFLLCGVLGPCNILVSDLLKYAIGLGVLKHVNSIEDARSKLDRIFVDLEETSSMLLQHGSPREVNVHALVCDAASLIAYRHHDVFTRNASLKDWPGEDFLARCTQIILKRCDMQRLPQRLDCPNLYFLYLDPNDNLTLEIPHSFFEGMGNLQVLVLIGMTITPSLPASLVSLAKLKTLCFNQCRLQDMAGIGALKSLEILSFFKSSMKELPSEIGRLTQLRMLDLSSSKIEIIPPNIISNLTKLEELYMGAVQEEHILAELMHLTRLAALELQIHGASSLRWCFIIFERLQRYNIVIGDKWECSDSNGSSRLLKLKLYPDTHLEEVFKAIVKTAEDLYFEGINGFSNVLNLHGSGLPLLKKLHIRNNSKIQHIVGYRIQTPAFPFPNLKTMILDDLDNLKQICLGPVAINAFETLKLIKVKSCGRLEYLFHIWMFENSPRIVEIEVSECSSMKNIVLLDTGTTSRTTKSILVDSLTLQHLPEISGFFSNERNVVGCPDIPTLFPNSTVHLLALKHLKLISISTIKRLVWMSPSIIQGHLEDLETMEIVECNDLDYLFVIEDSVDDIYDENSLGGLLPKLRKLCLLNLDSLTNIVVCPKNNHWRTLKFRMLNHLTVCGCNQLKFLLPLYVIHDLQQLKSIEISDCGKLEQVCADEKTQTRKSSSNVMKEVLPLLQSLKLSNLPELISICSGAAHVISGSLTQMTVENCPKFSFTFAYKLKGTEDQEPSKKKSKETIVIPSKLENLNLSKVDHLKNMCNYPLFSLMRLTSLQLDNCSKLEYLFSLSMAQELSSLRELKIISCDKIEQIVKRETEERASANTVEFPQVETLVLDQLPKFNGSFSSQDGASVKWVALDTVKVAKCPKIQKSMLGTVDRPLLKKVKVENCSPWEYEDLESNMGYLFEFTDELSKAENLRIEDSNKLKFMEMKLQQSSFRQLKTVEALRCDNELNKFLSILLHRSHKLERLTVERCELLEQVFDLGDLAPDKQGSRFFPNLHTMQLLCLPKLNCVWNKDPRGIMELGKLVKLEIVECGLRKIPLSTALVEELVLLEELKIESCEMIEQVIEDESEKQEISFRNLKDLQLGSLPKLIKFNSGGCNIRFPSLLSLRIEKCPELNAFTTGFLSKQALTIEVTSDHVPRNEIMHACPKLRKLKLAELKAVEADSLSRLEKLEALVMRNCSFLGRLAVPANCLNLREIEISDCNILEEIFTDKKTSRHLESIVLENLPVLSIFFSLETCEFPSLKNLRIVNCPRLETSPRNVSAKADNLMNKHSSELLLFEEVNDEDSLAGEGKMKIPPELELLELADLPNMQLWKQEPHQITVFVNLTSLKIMRCGGIEKLFSIRVAQHLYVLKLLKLYECVNMVQVLGGGGGGGGGGNSSKRVWVFKKLETLVLKHLPRLTSFCEDDADFGEFPELKMVRVENVPNMNTFVKKPLNTPKLKQVHVTFITKCWLRDLNTTIAYLHGELEQLQGEVWESDQSSTGHHTDTVESSSQANSRFKEVAEMELLEDEGLHRMES